MNEFLLGLLEPNIGFGSIFPIWKITTKTQENPTNFLFFSHFGNHQKFPVFADKCYLRTLLDGPALNSITGLPFTELNYKEAIEILTERFGNKAIITSSHLEALLKI